MPDNINFNKHENYTVLPQSFFHHNHYKIRPYSAKLKPYVRILRFSQLCGWTFHSAGVMTLCTVSRRFDEGDWLHL